MKWDIFISHAWEDKLSVARPLADLLTKEGLSVWIDENELKLGDSLRKKIDHGLAQSRFGVVILSEAFFSKNWPQAELNALASMESGRRKVILPVWHQIKFGDIAKFSLLLADRFAVSTDKGIEHVGLQVMRVIRRKYSIKLNDEVEQKQSWTLKDLEYIWIQCDNMSGEIEIGFREPKDKEEIHPKIIAGLAEKLIAPSLELLVIPMGTTVRSIFQSRLHVEKDRFSSNKKQFKASLNIDGIVSRFTEWNSYAAFLNFRTGWDRGIDRDFVDYYFSPSLTEGAFISGEVSQEKSQRRLQSLIVKLKGPILRLITLTLDEDGLEIQFKKPKWEKDVMPVYGGDCLWLKGMLR
jgi:hypothetical protein